MRERDAALRAAEAKLDERQRALQKWHEEAADFERESQWEHWRKDSMRKIMNELVSKVPKLEWKERMQHAMLQLELYKRQNLRLRQKDLEHRGADEEVQPERGLGDELVSECETLRRSLASAREELLGLRRVEASREQYLGVVQGQLNEAQARNEAQQRRLESLNAENAKLKRENTGLRSENSAARIDQFQNEILEQELQGVKDFKDALEQQVERLQKENDSLRDSDGLHRELASVMQQLRDALASKQAMGAALGQRLKRAQLEGVVLVGSLGELERDQELRWQEQWLRAEREAIVAERNRMATVLLLKATHLPSVQASKALSHVFHTWRTAAYLVDVGHDFHELRQRTLALAESSETLTRSVERLVVVESGKLALHQVTTLFNNWKEVMLAELSSTEGEAERCKAKLVESSAKLQRREDDLVLMIHRYEQQAAAHTALTQEIAAASDGSALEVKRLRDELCQLNGTCAEQRAEMEAGARALEQARAELRVREAQLAAVVSSVEADQVELELSRGKGHQEQRRLRAQLEKREEQLLAMVKELCALAAEEKAPGKVSHEARSRLFRRSASVFESLSRERQGERRAERRGAGHGAGHGVGHGAGVPLGERDQNTLGRAAGEAERAADM